MPIKVEVIGETPGVASIRIIGLAAAPTTQGGLIRFMRKDEKILSPSGQWLVDDHWLALPDLTLEGKALQGRIGANLVDPLSLLSAADIVLATVQLGGLRDEGRLTVKELRQSSLARTEAPATPEPAPPEPQRTEPMVEFPTEAPAYTPIQMDPEDARPTVEAPPFVVIDKQKSLLPIFLAAGIAGLAVVGGVVAYALGLFDSQSSSPATNAEATPAAQSAPQTPAPAASAVPSADAINSRDDLAKFIQATSDPAQAYQAATTLASKGKLEFAMLLFQHAARGGSLDGSVALARMYDPDSWSATTSPMPAADAETAAYWYEPAAQGGNAEAQRQLGKILMQLQPSGFQHDKGKEWLQKAADAGDAKAKDLLTTLK